MGGGIFFKVGGKEELLVKVHVKKIKNTFVI